MTQETNNLRIAPPDGFQYYTNRVYWNSFEAIRKRNNKIISGDENINYIHHFVTLYGKKEEAFILNCGNGWVERDLFRGGMANKFVGIDINSTAIEQAKTEADAIKMSSHYIVSDINHFDFSNYHPDIVINYAAMHHIAYINKVTEAIANMARNNQGLYIIYDYTGSHRNQYDETIWMRCHEVQKRLPIKYRTELKYPHIATMLATDPTEAIHSELQLDVMQRHFDILQHSQLGGGIAYILLYNNHNLHNEQHTAEGKLALQLIIDEDTQLLKDYPPSNLFSFIIVKAKNTTPSKLQCRIWQLEENERENLAIQNGGRYYPPTPIELKYHMQTPKHKELNLHTIQNIPNEIELFVSLLYRELFHREPDEKGLIHHTNRIIKGESYARVLKSFFDSKEYKKNLVPLFAPPGHFYSPIGDPKNIKAYLKRKNQQAEIPETVDGIAINHSEMIDMWQAFLPHFQNIPFNKFKTDGLLYQFDNPSYSGGDAKILFAMLHHLKPKRFIEIGSGWSSACTLDTLKILKHHTELAFIEPYPEKLLSILGETANSSNVTIIDKPVQEVPLQLFDVLQNGDILFIDSTHVFNPGSDVHVELFEILPRLARGVFVHIHDMFWPFEYPEFWIVEQNRSWNELYAVRLFLTNNKHWKIIFFNDYFVKLERQMINRTHPSFINAAGGALWLQKN